MTAAITRIVDLSHPIHDGTPVYPGDPVVRLRPAATLAADGFNLLQVCMGSQTGTHLDAPAHFIAGGAPIEQLDLALLCGPAVIADLRGRPARSPIGWDDLQPVADRLRAGVILVLHTGWSAHWDTPRYLDHPFLDGAAAAAILDRGVRTIAIDAPSLDETTASESAFAAHHVVLGAGAVIVENLTNLAAIDFPDPVLSLLPLPLLGADGAPVRAVALQLRS